MDGVLIVRDWGQGALLTEAVRRGGKLIWPRASSWRSSDRAAMSLRRPAWLRQPRSQHSSRESRVRLPEGCAVSQARAGKSAWIPSWHSHLRFGVHSSWAVVQAQSISTTDHPPKLLDIRSCKPFPRSRRIAIAWTHPCEGLTQTQARWLNSEDLCHSERQGQLCRRPGSHIMFSSPAISLYHISRILSAEAATDCSAFHKEHRQSASAR
jgi:hypothetical protein